MYHKKLETDINIYFTPNKNIIIINIYYFRALCVENLYTQEIVC